MTQQSENGLSSFDDFLDKRKDEISRVQAMLDMNLSDNPVELQAQLRDIESWYGRMSVILAHADYFLDIHASRVLPNREMGTELERKTTLDALCAPQRRFRDVLDGICRAISQRINLGQSLLRTSEREYSQNAIISE